MAPMADLVFLLMIFFLLTSTLVSPNAIKLSLPEAGTKTISKQSTFVYITDSELYYVNKKPVAEKNLKLELSRALIGQSEGVIVMRAQQNVRIKAIVTLIDAVNDMNKLLKTRHKVILATQPKAK